MTKIDKKLISLTLIIAMVFTMFCPVITNAAENVPEDAIEFEDQALFTALKNVYMLDSNKDGYITVEEMESLKTLSLYNISNVKSFDELKYAVNLESLNISGLSKDFSDYTFLKSFSKLKYFTISKSLGEINHEYKEESKIETATNLFVLDSYYDNTWQEVATTTYNLYGIALVDNLEMPEKEIGSIIQEGILLPTTLSDYLKIEDDTIVKIVYNSQIEAINEGSTKIICKSDFSTKEIPVTITKSDITVNSDPELENSDITSKIVYDRILMSNGDLWKVNSKTEVEKEDTNVSDYVYVHFYSGMKSMYVKLKDNGNLNIDAYSDNYEIQGEQFKTKEITGVKQILSNTSARVAYLTNDNDVYLLDINLENGEVQTTLMASNVEKAEGAFYVKDGKTYYIDGTLVAEEEMDSAVKGTFAIGNDIYVVEDYVSSYTPNISYKLFASDFASFAEEQYYGAFGAYYNTTSGELKATSGSMIDGEKYRLQIIANYGTYPLALNYENTLGRYNLAYLTHVKDYNVIYNEMSDGFRNPSYIIAVREDGTVWVKDYTEQYAEFKKLISQEDDDENLGNIDGDDEVTIKDVKLTLQYSLSKEDLSDVQIKAADVNKDGKVDIKDVRLILLYSLQKIDSFEEAK